MIVWRLIGSLEGTTGQGEERELTLTGKLGLTSSRSEAKEEWREKDDDNYDQSETTHPRCTFAKTAQNPSAE